MDNWFKLHFSYNVSLIPLLRSKLLRTLGLQNHSTVEVPCDHYIEATLLGFLVSAGPSYNREGLFIDINAIGFL